MKQRIFRIRASTKPEVDIAHQSPGLADNRLAIGKGRIKLSVVRTFGTDGCEPMLENFKSRPCTDAEKTASAGRKKAAAEVFGQANQTRWFDDYRKLPMILEGGGAI